jgi:hypothetical protein
MGFPSKTQLWEDRCNCPDDVDSHPNALIQKASIAFKIQTSGRQFSWSGRASTRYGNCVHQSNRSDDHPLVQTREALVWKLLAVKVRSSGQQGTIVRTRLKPGKNFSEIFGKPIVQLSVRTPYDYRLDDA